MNLLPNILLSSPLTNYCSSLTAHKITLPIPPSTPKRFRTSEDKMCYEHVFGLYCAKKDIILWIFVPLRNLGQSHIPSTTSNNDFWNWSCYKNIYKYAICEELQGFIFQVNVSHTDCGYYYHSTCIKRGIVLPNLPINLMYNVTTTLNILFSATQYLKLHIGVNIYCISHILPTNMKLVVWVLLHINNFTW